LDTAATSATNSSSSYTDAVTQLSANITQVRSDIQNLNLPKTLPIGTADAGSEVSIQLCEAVDFFMANVCIIFTSVLFFCFVCADTSCLWPGPSLVCCLGRAMTVMQQRPITRFSFLCLDRFAGVLVDAAATWTWSYYTENDVQTCQAATNNPSTYIAETGWPTQSMTPGNATYEGAVSGLSELQTFLECVPFLRHVDI
jgi:glucan 1,3-beta-glucosidase